jgi:hypothetical protein
MYAGTTLDNSVAVSYSGIGSSATVVFNINTLSTFATKNLYLGCLISGTSTTVYSTNTVAFTVIGCTLTGLNPTSNFYSYNYK